MLKTGSLICFVIRGKHPVCGEPLFCFSANPDSLSELCGFHINHRSRSFLLKVSGVSSHLSFCCTSLVSGFIIQKNAQFVYSQSAQQIRHTFASKVQNSGIHEFRLSGALLHLPGQRLCPADRAGPLRNCSGILNRYHHRACSYINLICPLYNPWIIMSISPHPKARKWYRWLRISKEIVQIA